MSLVGFQANNHPQQTGLRGALAVIDDRGTHPMYFAPWDERFGGFTLDAAAAPHNAKCERYFTLQDDGLKQSWAGERVWCNPPYSDIYSWVRKAWNEWRGTRGIVMLLPANRPEQKWWQELVEPYRDSAGVGAARRVPRGPDALHQTGPDGDRAERAPSIRMLPADLG